MGGRKGAAKDARCAALSMLRARAPPPSRPGQIQLVRNVTGKQFTDAIEEALAPRLG